MKTLLVFFVAIITVSSGFRTNTKGSLNITLSNITQKGKINVAVYKDGEDFPSDKFLVKGQTGECNSATCSFQFQDLPYGNYAVAIYQDVNANGKLDTGTFGIPTEPFAFSNNFKPKWGGPSFEKCRFEFSQDNQTLSITMINSLFGGD